MVEHLKVMASKAKSEGNSLQNSIDENPWDRKWSWEENIKL